MILFVWMRDWMEMCVCACVWDHFCVPDDSETSLRLLGAHQSTTQPNLCLCKSMTVSQKVFTIWTGSIWHQSDECVPSRKMNKPDTLKDEPLFCLIKGMSCHKIKQEEKVCFKKRWQTSDFNQIGVKGSQKVKGKSMRAVECGSACGNLLSWSGVGSPLK